ISVPSRSACETQREARHSSSPRVVDQLDAERADRCRLPENMSACSWQAVSHVGCRLAVASSAKINLPPLDSFILVRKASISARVGIAGETLPRVLGGDLSAIMLLLCRIAVSVRV